MKKLYVVFSFLLFAEFGVGQTTIFSENMGAGTSGGAAMNTYTGWQNNSSLCFSGTGDVRNTTASSGYTGASGAGNAFLTNTAGKNFKICCINTGTCSTLSLSFGVYKNGAGTSTDLQVSFSTDGGTSFGTPITVTITGGAVWSLQTISSGIPTGTNVCIQFNNAGGSQQLRIDDVNLTSNCSSGGGTSSPTYPVGTAVVVNGCGSAASPSCPISNPNSDCAEGMSEIYFFRNGTTAIASAQVHSMPAGVITYYSYSFSTPTYSTGVSMNNAATTTYLNSNACGGSCGSCFVDAWSGGIPAGATFMLVSDYFCTAGTDFTSLCTNSTTHPIYVIYFGASTNNSNDCGGGTTGWWNPGGDFGNNSPTHYFSFNFSWLSMGISTQYYQYDGGNASINNDGGSIELGDGSASSSSPAAPSTYTAATCSLPIVLPVNLLTFTGSRTDDGSILVKWATAEEVNNDYFELQYSFDGESFAAYKQLKGMGNTTHTTNYSCNFTQDIGNKTPYFRLKQVDFDGNYKYSQIITVGNYSSQSNTVFYYNTDNDKVIARFKLDYSQNVNVSLYNTTGAELFSTKNYFNEGDNQLQIPAPDKGGVYTLIYQAEGSAPIHKKIMIVK